MKIYDLSKELFSAAVFPGDPAPAKTPFRTISQTCPCNLTVLTLGSHNGTHMDAPKHFVAGAKDIAQVPLEKCVGPCKVARFDGLLTAADANRLLADGTKRLLIRGEIEISVEAAEAFAEAGLWFLGVEGMTVGGRDNRRHRAPRAAFGGDRAARVRRAFRGARGDVFPLLRAAQHAGAGRLALPPAADRF